MGLGLGDDATRLVECRGGRRIPIILRRGNRTVVIHFDGGAAAGRDGAVPQVVLNHAHFMEWYCRGTDGQVDAVYALLPEEWSAHSAEIAAELRPARPVWYGENGVRGFPEPENRQQIWLINGGRLPIVDWVAACSEAQRQDSDVLIFGPSADVAEHRYPESVVVSADGEFIRFRRHYDDSPLFADHWAGEASFLVTTGENAPAVVNHLVTRGWTLESVGAMTRRFRVRWSQAPCALSEFNNRRSAFSGADPEVSGPAANGPAATGDTGRGGSVPSPARRGGRLTCSSDPPALPRAGRPYRLAKRALDLACSAAGLLVLSPLILLVAVLIKCTSRGPVFFAHKRQGLGGKEFRCLKFRSMRVGADALQAQLRAQNEVDGPQFKITDDPRLTPLGGWLRRCNIDELPQLLNVLLGQMSLVGPRPSPDNENQLCPAWRRTRLSVKPGITGLWQVLRRRGDENASDFQEWIYYDIEYTKHQSLWLDIQLLLYTPISMFAPRRIARLAERLARRGICAYAATLHGAAPESQPAHEHEP